MSDVDGMKAHRRYSLRQLTKDPDADPEKLREGLLEALEGYEGLLRRQIENVVWAIKNDKVEEFLDNYREYMSMQDLLGGSLIRRSVDKTEE